MIPKTLILSKSLHVSIFIMNHDNVSQMYTRVFDYYIHNTRNAAVTNP